MLRHSSFTWQTNQKKELAAAFDRLEISLRKTDPTLDKSNALQGLVVPAVERAKEARELKGGNTNQIATDVCTTLRYMTRRTANIR